MADTTVAGSAGLSQDFTLGVADLNETPTDLAISAASIDENLVAGTVVGTLSATDEDANDTFTYALVSGAGDTGNASFEITDGKLSTKAAFDFEAKPTYSIRVKTTDAGGLSVEKTLSITVVDVNEAPTALALENAFASVDENTDTSGRTKIADIAVTDDALGTNTLSLSGTDAASFEIVCTELFLKAGVALDHETKP